MFGIDVRYHKRDEMTLIVSTQQLLQLRRSSIDLGESYPDSSFATHPPTTEELESSCKGKPRQ